MTHLILYFNGGDNYSRSYINVNYIAANGTIFHVLT